MTDLDPAALVGSWAIDRDLLDRSTGLAGTFVGELVVSPGESGDELTWQESGTLRWNGRAVPANRRLLLRRIDGEWWMTFADGQPFHRWTIDEPVVHPCAADTYRGLITTGPPGSAGSAGEVTELTITWDVTGPTKDQLIGTTVSRRV